MKRAGTISAIILLMAAVGCSGGGNQSTDEFITVDVTKRYPKKELKLQDFMEVEYIPLETSDNFLTQGRVLAINKDYIVIRNRWNDGDIFIFDRTAGKGLKKINRRGQGPEEYSDAVEVIIDEEFDEIYVSDPSVRRIILIYDLDGKFKRSLRYKEGVSYGYIHNFDRENLICYDVMADYRRKNEIYMHQHPLLLISKRDGSITKEIQIPYEKKISTVVSARIGDMAVFFNAARYPITCYFGNWALSLSSSDTIYRYQPDHTVTPLIVRTPSIQSMGKPKVFLYPRILTDRYYFMETVKTVIDSDTKRMPSTDLLYDRQKNTLFEYKFYNNDYVEKIPVSLISTSPTIPISPNHLMPRPLNDEIATWQVLDAYQLVEDYNKGRLRGRLKEIAAELDEEDNPVIMLVKYKK